MALFVIGGASLSVVPQVYFPAYAPGPHTVRPDCTAKHLELVDDLLDHAGRSISSRDTAQTDAWLSGWDARFSAIARSCPQLRQTREDMARLRNSVGELIDTHNNEHLPLQAKIQSLLDAMPARPTHLPPET